MAVLAGSEARAEASRWPDAQALETALPEPRPDMPADSRVATWNDDNQRTGHVRFQGLQLPCTALGRLFAGVDGLVILAGSLLGAKSYQFLISGASWNLNAHVGAGAAGALVYLLIARSSGFYQPKRIFSPGRKDASEILRTWCLTGLSLTLLAFLLRIGTEFSRGAIVCYLLIVLASLVISRGLMKRSLEWTIRQGRVQGRRVVLVGVRDEIATLDPADLLRRFGLTEVGRVVLPDIASWSLAVSRPVQASLQEALTSAREREADAIVLALGWYDTRSVDLVRDQLRSSPLPVQLLPDRRVRYLTGNPAFSVNRSFSIEIQRTPLSELEQAAKRTFDIVGAMFGLTMLLPAMLVTALAIKIDSPGPVLFRQRRSGFNAMRFTILKFRTMTVMEDGEKVSQATRQDPRITRIGGILRATSIDELPQLVNVLLGEMSLVGPRPHAVAHDDQYGHILADYAYRHHVKPGITGWAQVHGLRGGTAEVGLMKKRLDFDLWYISNWHLGLDVLVLLKTCLEVLRRRNAY